MIAGRGGGRPGGGDGSRAQGAVGDNRWTGVIGGRLRGQWPEVVVGRVGRKRMNSEDAGARRAGVGVCGRKVSRTRTLRKRVLSHQSR